MMSYLVHSNHSCLAAKMTNNKSDAILRKRDVFVTDSKRAREQEKSKREKGEKEKSKTERDETKWKKKNSNYSSNISDRNRNSNSKQQLQTRAGSATIPASILLSTPLIAMLLPTCQVTSKSSVPTLAGPPARLPIHNRF